MQRLNPHRIHLYLLRPDGARGAFQSLGSANGFLPSLWQVLLATGSIRQELCHIIGSGQRDDCWVGADAQGALQQYIQLAQMIRQHPDFDAVDGLDRYLDATQAYLGKVICEWLEPGALPPVLCVNLSVLPLAPTDPAPPLTQLRNFSERLDAVLRTRDHESIVSLLQFATRNLRFTDWRAWSGMFGLAQFEPVYFSGAFRDPVDCNYVDFDYDDFGSESELGNGCYRIRRGKLWGVDRKHDDAVETVIAAQWDRVLRTGSGDQSLVWLRQSGRYGLAAITGERAGQQLREPDLDEVQAFQNGTAIARVKHSVGLLDTHGQWRLAPCMDSIYAFAHERAVVHRNGKFGFIDTSGRQVIDLEFDEADDFTVRGVARVARDGACGLIDRNGDVVLPILFQRVEWSDAFDGWLCESVCAEAGAIGTLKRRLIHADGTPWIDGDWDAIEVFVRNELIRVVRGGCVGLMRWSGHTAVPCEFEELKLRDSSTSGLMSAHARKLPMRASKRTESMPQTGDKVADQLIARRTGLTGLISHAGDILIPFDYAYLDALEPHVEDNLRLDTPEFMRVLSMPGKAAPQVGVWDIARGRLLVACQYDFVWTCLFAADGTYGFIVGNRNPKRGSASLGRYRVGLLRADGTVLVPQVYAWIAESTPLNREDAMMDIRSTLYHDWSCGKAVRASIHENGPMVSVDADGKQYPPSLTVRG